MKQTSDLFEIPNVLFAGAGALRLAVAVVQKHLAERCVCVYPCWVRVPSQVSVAKASVPFRDSMFLWCVQHSEPELKHYRIQKP